MSLKEAHDRELQYKNLAKSLAELSGETVLFAPSPDKYILPAFPIYLASRSFTPWNWWLIVSEILDHCEQCLDQVLRKKK